MDSRLCRALCVLGFGWMTALPAVAVDIPDIPHEFYTLDNGLEVILHEDHSTPIVGVNIWYHVGSKNERPGRSGFAHLFEHLMFQGSEHQDAEYFGPLHEVGAIVNGSTNEDRTNYWEVVPSNELERALLLEADRMGWLLPAMTPEKLANQQDVVRNERRESEGGPYSSFWLNFNRNLYPKGHPYDHSVIGIHEDLENATLEDVKEFFRTYYTPNNSTLSIAGDFDPAEAKLWIAEYFGPIAPGPPVEEVETWVPVWTADKRIRSEDDVQLARTYYAWHSAPYYHEGDADMDLAAKILGQGASSRLVRRLVHEEKLAQEVSARQGSQQIGSAFVITVTLRPGADARRMETILDEEIARFAADGPTEAELERAKSVFEAGFLKGIQRVGSWGGINDRLNRYNHFVGTPDYFRQDYERFMSRTTDTVRKELAACTARGRLVHEFVPVESLEATEVAEADYSTLPQGGDPPAMAAPSIQRRTMDDGLRLAVLEQHELPLVRVDLTFRSGSAAEGMDHGGLADLAGDMLLKGTRRRDRFEFENALEGLGTDLGFSTEDDFAQMWMLSLRKNLDRSMDLMAEALLEPAFPEKEFTDQKERRINNIHREKDSPRTIAFKATAKIVFGADHPYAKWSAGTEESVSALTLDDVRRYAEEHFTPANATLVAVGDITLEELEKAVARHLGKWTGAAPLAARVPDPPRHDGRVVYLIDKPGDTQSTVSVAHLGMARSDPGWERMFVANRVLGGSFTSRLNLNLREDKGYTYGARSSTWERKDTGCFTMSARVQTDATAPALTEFVGELEGIAGARPISQEELEFAKGSILLGYPREFETIGQIANAVSEQVAYGLPDDNFATYPERIRAVDLETVNDTAASYFNPDDVAIIVVGDLKKIEGSIRELNLGPIRYADRDGVIQEHQELSSR